jgi:excisionase family DNA binding protein
MTTDRGEPTNKRLMSVPEFSKCLSVTQSCVRRWILERRVRVIKLGRLVRIPASECERLISEGLRPARRHTENPHGFQATE